MVTDTSLTFTVGPDPERMRPAPRHFVRRGFMITRIGGFVTAQSGYVTVRTSGPAPETAAALTAFVRTRVAGA
ncbi:hypothetical protein [Actinoplanes sp. NPDC020271]|uniref:hypothetical protein n=1 Tax=Actinoplanes sp. NPDC020271 TaxID=3363896 RepID=UPI0037A8BC0F